MTATLTHHKRHQLLLDLLKLLAVHGTDLTNTKGNITLTDKLLVILVKKSPPETYPSDYFPQKTSPGQTPRS